MKSYGHIKIVSIAKTPDGAGGYADGVETVLYETMAAVKPVEIRRTVDALASEVNYGAAFDLFLPPNLTIGTDTPIYINGKKHAIVGVKESPYPPIKHTVTAERRDQ